jgi:hypothetical protein
VVSPQERTGSSDLQAVAVRPLHCGSLQTLACVQEVLRAAPADRTRGPVQGPQDVGTAAGGQAVVNAIDIRGLARAPHVELVFAVPLSETAVWADRVWAGERAACVGDTAFAHALRGELERRGHEPLLHTRLDLACWLRMASRRAGPRDAEIYVATARGVRVMREGLDRKGTYVRNYASAKEAPDRVIQAIKKYTNFGAAAHWSALSPVTDVPGQDKPTDVLALGAVPQPTDADPGKVRLVQDGSAPKGQSVNDYLEKQQLQCDSVMTVAHSMHTGCWLYKMDLRNAYLNFPTTPDSWGHAGFYWDGTYYAFVCLAFGLSNSAAWFNLFAALLCHEAIHRIKQVPGWGLVGTLFNYYDDYIGHEQDEAKAYKAFCVLLSLSIECGVGLAEDKLAYPNTVMKFLGLQLSSIDLSVRLPDDKKQMLQEMVMQLSHNVKYSLKELQSVTGKLNFAATVVQGLRPWLRHVIDLSVQARLYGKVAFGEQVLVSLQEMVQHLLQQFNGKMIMQHVGKRRSPDIETDASHLVGWGWFRHVPGGQPVFAAGRWAGDQLLWDINIQELYTVKLALEQNAQVLAGTWVRFLVDNSTAIAQANKLTAAHAGVALELVKQIWMLTVKWDIQLNLLHLPGVLNIRADALSREYHDILRTELSKLTMRCRVCCSPGWCTVDDGTAVLNEHECVCG